MPSLAEASLSETDRRTLERFVERLEEELRPRLSSVWLYGSRARGELPHRESAIVLFGEP
jgi:predicted nucleotidyltransferase